MLKYILDIFRSDSPNSFARWATAGCIIAAICNLTYLVVHNNALPDGTALFALGAWMTAPYAVNKCASAFYKQPPDTPAS